MRAALSAPLFARERCVGAVKVYAREPGAFSVRDERLLTLFAGQAGVLLAHTRSHEETHRTSARFKDVLRSRDVLNMAKGALMEREDITEEAAFGMLLSLAAARGQDAAEVAAAMITRHTGG
jgi:GAF domain-containing protein